MSESHPPLQNELTEDVLQKMRSEISLVRGMLREQRRYWQEISERVAGISERDLSPESPKRILIFGIGSSHFAARLSAFALIRDKSRTRLPVVACSSLGIGTEIVPKAGDWAIGISHSGETPLTLKALETCDRAGAFTVMVTGQGAKVPETVRYHLTTTPMEQAYTHTASVTGAICAITTLLLGSKCLEEWDALRSIGEPSLSIMRRRAGRGPTIIMGEWEGEWMAKEAALKLMELPRVGVRAFGSEEFFHGPKLSRRPDDVLWHISLPKDPRNNDIAALKPAHSIGVFGSSPLAWMPGLVELQWLALATAMNVAGLPEDANED